MAPSHRYTRCAATHTNARAASAGRSAEFAQASSRQNVALSDNHPAEKRPSPASHAGPGSLPSSVLFLAAAVRPSFLPQYPQEGKAETSRPPQTEPDERSTPPVLPAFQALSTPAGPLRPARAGSGSRDNPGRLQPAPAQGDNAGSQLCRHRHANQLPEYRPHTLLPGIHRPRQP